MLLTGYLLHYLPYFFYDRTLFLHHYLPAYLYKIMLAAYFLSHCSYHLRSVMCCMLSEVFDGYFMGI